MTYISLILLQSSNKYMYMLFIHSFGINTYTRDTSGSETGMFEHHVTSLGSDYVQQEIIYNRVSNYCTYRRDNACKT